MITKGTRVVLHPACDEWMQGDRYGTVIGYGHAREYHNKASGETVIARPYRVKLDSGRVRRFHPDNILEAY